MQSAMSTLKDVLGEVVKALLAKSWAPNVSPALMITIVSWTDQFNCTTDSMWARHSIGRNDPIHDLIASLEEPVLIPKSATAFAPWYATDIAKFGLAYASVATQ